MSIKKNMQQIDLFDSAAVGNIAELTRNLLENPHGINKPNADGFYVLHLSCANNRIEATAQLIFADADVNAISQNNRKLAPLHSAAANQNIEIIRLLLDNGADPIIIQAAGYTALHYAAELNNKQLLKLLLERGADKSVKTNNGKTAFSIAEEKKFSQIKKMLL